MLVLHSWEGAVFESQAIVTRHLACYLQSLGGVRSISRPLLVY